MILSHLSLQSFRSYPKATFDFPPTTTVIVGPNTAGKSNLIEAIFLLATGKSFRAEKQAMLISFGREMARVKGKVASEEKEEKLEVMLTVGEVAGVKAPLVRYLVNDVPKRRVDFAGILPSVLFAPSDLEILIGSPGKRREFLDLVLEQVSLEYRQAVSQYSKALRQRNALLEYMRESGKASPKQLVYWNEVLIRYGTLITTHRETFINFINDSEKSLFSFRVHYDHSLISEERLRQYEREEAAAGVTLVGPHRDDFQVHMHNKEESDIRYFGSRGQQRLAILQLKMLQIAYITKLRGERPLLLLDDIFSELDDTHIKHVSGLLADQQTILTTTHKEFLSNSTLKKAEVIELEKE